MAESSPARRPVPLIESGKALHPRFPGRPGPRPCPAASHGAPAPDPIPRLPPELYFLIARYLSAGPCRRAAQVSAGLAGGGPSRPRHRLGSREEGAGGPGWVDRGAAPAPLTVRIVGCRCWCRSWSSTRSVHRGAPAPCPPVPAVPPPSPRPALFGVARRPRPAALLPPPPPRTRVVVTRVHLVSLQLLPKRLDWEGNEHNRSYEELVRLLTFASRVSEPPPPFRGSGRWGEVSGPRSAAGGRASERAAGRGVCRASRGRLCFVLFLGWLCVCFGRKRRPGGPPGSAGRRRGRPCGRFAAGWPQVRCRGWAAGARVRAAARPPSSALLPAVSLLPRLVTLALIGRLPWAPPTSQATCSPGVDRTSGV